jgi:hypothetical protein
VQSCAVPKRACLQGGERDANPLPGPHLNGLLRLLPLGPVHLPLRWQDGRARPGQITQGTDCRRPRPEFFRNRLSSTEQLLNKREPQSMQTRKQRLKWIAKLYPLRLAPVFFVTSATILPAAASISASVRVLSRGCKVTDMATDFLPSGMPLPS